MFRAISIFYNAHHADGGTRIKLHGDVIDSNRFQALVIHCLVPINGRQDDLRLHTEGSYCRGRKEEGDLKL